MIIPTSHIVQTSVFVPVGTQIWVDGVPTRGTCTCGQTLLVVEDPYGVYPKRFKCPNPKWTGCM